VREVGEFAVEAIGRLPERHVADTVVPRRGRGRADGERVLGHRRQYDRVALAVCHEHGNRGTREGVAAIEFAREQRAADGGRHDHIPCQGGRQLIVAERPGGAGAQEAPGRGGVREQVRNTHFRCVLEHSRTDVVECRGPEDHSRTDQVDAADPGVSAGAEVVRDDVAAI